MLAAIETAIYAADCAFAATVDAFCAAVSSSVEITAPCADVISETVSLLVFLLAIANAC